MFSENTMHGPVETSINSPLRATIMHAAMLFACTLALNALTAGAATTYTSRAEWEAAAGQFITEDLESEVPGNYLTPYTTVGGITLQSLGIAHAINIVFFPEDIFVPPGVVDRSNAIHHRDWSGEIDGSGQHLDSTTVVVGKGISYSLGGLRMGFGFDWHTAAVEGWDVSVNGNILATLPESQRGFFGVIDPHLISRFVLSSSHDVQGGIIVDNISVATIPAPAMLNYRIATGQFEFSNGETWVISGGEMSVQLFDVLVSPEGHQRAVYGISAFSLTAVDLLGARHTVTAVPDGLRSPVFHDPIVPDIVQDIGLVNVYPDGFLDMIVYDLSIDGEVVDPLDTIGGPAFASQWLGTFPEPLSFAVSMHADLRSKSLHGELTLVAVLVPEPASLLLTAVGMLVISLRRADIHRTHYNRFGG